MSLRNEAAATRWYIPLEEEVKFNRAVQITYNKPVKTFDFEHRDQGHCTLRVMALGLTNAREMSSCKM